MNAVENRNLVKQQLESALHEKESLLREQYEELGRVYFENVNVSDVPFAMQEALQKVSQSVVEIRKIKNQQRTLEGEVYCETCDKYMPAGSLFCISCGKALGKAESVCANCGKVLGADNLFCPYCGTPKSRESEPEQDSSPVAGSERRCKNCGNILEPEEIFCTNCGAKADMPAYAQEAVAAQEETLRCAVCGELLDEDSDFCTSCGNRVTQAKTAAVPEPVSREVRCSVCGAVCPSGENYCPACGASIKYIF